MRSDAAPLRVGVIGCGGIAQMMHLPTLAERPDLFRLVAVANRDRATLDAVAERYGLGHEARHERWLELVEREDVEAVLLLAGGMHHEAAVSALARGKHLFVEKPLDHCRSQVEKIRDAAERAGPQRVVMVGYQKRYNQAFRKLREIVRGMNDLLYVDVTVLHHDDQRARRHHAILPVDRSRAQEGTPLERATARVSSGPFADAMIEVLGDATAPLALRVAAMVLTSGLVHDMNLVRAVLGEPEGVVSSHVWAGGLAQSSVTRFAGGVHCNMTFIATPGLQHYRETLCFVSPDQRVTLELPSPYLRHHPAGLLVERMNGEELVVERLVVSCEDAFRAELHAFRRHIRAQGRDLPETNLDDAVCDVRWVEALARASSLATAPSLRQRHA